LVALASANLFENFDDDLFAQNICFDPIDAAVLDAGTLRGMRRTDSREEGEDRQRREPSGSTNLAPWVPAASTACI
jgi:hypothetical protein